MAKIGFTIVNIGHLSINKYWGETERVRQASATCTLLEADGCRLIVDPSPHPEPLAERLFGATGLRPAAIDLVFVTHFHGDHRFGIELFADKPWLMASAALEEWKAGAPKDAGEAGRFRAAEGSLPEGVTLFPSPGHTRRHHSLLAETEWGSVIVAGDAVMTPEFFAHDDGYHNTYDFALVRETIRKIKAVADYVVPGHGNYFPVGA